MSMPKTNPCGVSFLAVATFALLLTPKSCGADLIDMGGSTVDTETSLEWLDLPATVNLSPTMIFLGDDPGGLLAAGWRYASFAEIATLMAHSGLQAPLDGSSPQDFAAASRFIDLLGATGAESSGPYAAAYAPEGIASRHGWWYSPFAVLVQAQTSGIASVPGAFAGLGSDLQPQPNLGNWLVRTFIPAPTKQTTWGTVKARYRDKR